MLTNQKSNVRPDSVKENKTDDESTESALTLSVVRANEADVVDEVETTARSTLNSDKLRASKKLLETTAPFCCIYVVWF